MFGLKKKGVPNQEQSTKYLVAPVSGMVLPLTELADPVFAQGMLGQGFAIQALTGSVNAPLSGEITVMDGHAVGLKGVNGLEVLIHIGLDTVALAGRPFTALIEQGAHVQVGQPIVAVDWSAIQAAGYDPVTIVLLPTYAGDLAFKVNLVNHQRVETSEPIADIES